MILVALTSKIKIMNHHKQKIIGSHRFEIKQKILSYLKQSNNQNNIPFSIHQNNTNQQFYIPQETLLRSFQYFYQNLISE
jgi:hypothetical protein